MLRELGPERKRRGIDRRMMGSLVKKVVYHNAGCG
jgi:hypothetical protein